MQYQFHEVRGGDFTFHFIYKIAFINEQAEFPKNQLFTTSSIIDQIRVKSTFMNKIVWMTDL